MKNNVKTIPAMTRAAEKRRNERLSGIRKTAVIEPGESISIRRSQRVSAISRTTTSSPINGSITPMNSDHNCECDCQTWRRKLMSYMNHLEMRLEALEENTTIPRDVRTFRRSFESSINFPAEDGTNDSVFSSL